MLTYIQRATVKKQKKLNFGRTKAFNEWFQITIKKKNIYKVIEAIEIIIATATTTTTMKKRKKQKKSVKTE